MSAAYSPLCNSIPIRVLNRNCNALIDTGAGRSILSKQWCDTLHLQLDPLQNDDPSILVNADKGHMKVWGTVQMDICINGVSVLHKFLVIDNLVAKVLLGCDFLTKTEATIDLKRQLVSFFDGSAIVKLTSRNDNFQLAYVTSTLKLKSKTEYIIKLKLVRPFRANDTVMLEPNDIMLQQGIAVAGCIVNPIGKNVVCRIFNTTDNEIILNKNTKVATAKKLTCNAIQEQPERTHLEAKSRKYKFEELGIDLTNADLTVDQKHKLEKLITEFGDIFAKTCLDLAQETNLGEHRIQIKEGAKVVNLRPYKASPQIKAEIVK